MAYKQPNVPRRRDGGNTWSFLDDLTRFLRDFCQAAWNADRMKDAEIERIKKRLDALDGGEG